MSGVTVGTVASVVAATAAAAGTGIAAHQGNKASKQAKKGQAIAVDSAKKTEVAADQAMNAANKKSPNVAQMQGNNTAAAKGGVGSTMLTGSSGIDNKSLNLASNTLLGA